ncbi:hypothetical protein BSKO_00072 [Bryopsis sp. KO-2023]|nr:hypothetical protein BSKO_00072 [Bryopsis sp. KO-2023]
MSKATVTGFVNLTSSLVYFNDMRLRSRQTEQPSQGHEEEDSGKEMSTDGSGGEGEEFVVERIENMKFVGDRIDRVFIRWEGYSAEHDSWEGIDMLTDKIETYPMSASAKRKLDQHKSRRLKGRPKARAVRGKKKSTPGSAGRTPPSTTLGRRGSNKLPPRGRNSGGDYMDVEEEVEFPKFPPFRTAGSTPVPGSSHGVENSMPAGVPRRSSTTTNGANVELRRTPRNTYKRAPPAPWNCTPPPKKKGKSVSGCRRENGGPEAVSLLSSDDEGCLVNVPKAPDLGQLKTWELYNPPYNGEVEAVEPPPQLPCLEAPPAQDEAGPSQENPRPSLPETQSRQPSVEEREEAILKPIRESGDALYFEKRYAEADNKYMEGLRQLGSSPLINLKKDMICRRAAVAMQLGKYVDVVKMFQDSFWNAYDSHRWLLMQALWLTCEGDDGMKTIIKHAKAIRSGLKKHVDMLEPFCVPSMDVVGKIKDSLETALDKKAKANVHFRKQEFSVAIQKYTEAIEFEEKGEGCAPVRFVAILHSNLGQAQYCVNQYYDGILSCCRAQVVDPSFIKSTLRLADCLEKLNYNKAAVDICRKTQMDAGAADKQSLQSKVNSIPTEGNAPSPDPQKLLGLNMPIFNQDMWRSRRKTVLRETHPDKQNGFTDKISRSLGQRHAGEVPGPSLDKEDFDKRASIYFTWCFGMFHSVINTEETWRQAMKAFTNPPPIQQSHYTQPRGGARQPYAQPRGGARHSPGSHPRGANRNYRR